MLFGGHVGGGVKAAPERAEAIGADALQLFVQSPRAWRFPNHDPEVLGSFEERARAAGMEAWIVHAIYLCNFASPDDEIYAKSVSTLRSTVDAACAIGADGVVFHVGSHLGSGFDAGLDRAAPAIQQVLERCSDTTWLLIENSAGTGGTMGRSIEEIAQLVDRLGAHPRLGVCLDSCHLWASGVDVTDAAAFDAVLDEFDRGSGSIGYVHSTSTTRSRRSARTATAMRTSRTASSARASKSSSETSGFKAFRRSSRRRAPTATGRTRTTSGSSSSYTRAIMTATS